MDSKDFKPKESYKLIEIKFNNSMSFNSFINFEKYINICLYADGLDKFTYNAFIIYSNLDTFKNPPVVMFSDLKDLFKPLKDLNKNEKIKIIADLCETFIKRYSPKGAELIKSLEYNSKRDINLLHLYNICLCDMCQILEQ